MTSSKQKHMSAKMTFLEELHDIQNCILGKSQELNSRSMHFENTLKFVLPLLFILVSETSAGCISCIKNLTPDQLDRISLVISK